MQLITNAIKQLIFIDPFYGLFAVGLNKAYSNQIKTCGVTAQDNTIYLIVNKEYFSSKTKEEQIGLMWHEILHIVFNHPYTDYSKYTTNFDIINVAADLEVNSYIPDKYRPKDGTAEQLTAMYNIPRKLGTVQYIQLLMNLQKKKNSNKSNNFQRNSSNDDDHKTWSKLSEEEKKIAKSQAEFLIKSIAQAVKKQNGSVPGELKELIEKLLYPPKPVTDWKRLLYNFMTNKCSFLPKKTRRKESLRFEDSFGLKKQKKHSLLVAIDTSGSLNTKELAEFFVEIHRVYKQGADIDIVECDAKITKQYHYTGVPPTCVTGRGGTNFKPVIDYFNENLNKYSTLIYFTDGLASLNNINPKKKMIWVISSNGDKNQKYPGIKLLIEYDARSN